MRISDWSSDVCSSDLAEKHRAVMVVGIEPVAQQIGRGLRDQETYLRARRAAEGAAQQIGDEARGALCGLERDVTDRKSVVSGKSVSVRVDLGGSRIIKKKNKK